MFFFRHLARFLAVIGLVVQANAATPPAEDKSHALEIFDAARGLPQVPPGREAGDVDGLAQPDELGLDGERLARRMTRSCMVTQAETSSGTCGQDTERACCRVESLVNDPDALRALLRSYHHVED